MSGRLKPLDPLLPQQRDASAPGELVWLSASAGTGKTHVLTARVLRLLLGGAAPESILCLTFTKAGAAEMAERIHRRLAHWAGLKDDSKLAQDLTRLGEDHDPEALKRARRLFARVLDAPGGGLRIQTIHAFCQTLLAGFPAEAGLTPGFRPIEGREEAALARRTLAEMLDGAARGGDQPLIRDVQALSLRLGEGGAESYLLDCARQPEALGALGSREAIEPRLRQAFGAPLGDVEEAVERGCAELDTGCFRAIAAANATWNTASGLRDADIIARFLGGGPKQRAAMLEEVLFVVLTKGFEPRKYQAGLLKADPDYAGHCADLAERIGKLLGWRTRAALAAAIGAGLRAGQAYAAAYARAKQVAGLVDFDDLIRATVRLLDTPGMGDWVRYKLDQSTDHILVDEAQDTNAAQWAIVDRLAEEFFAGAGARGQALRTIFTVGDFKQAIFGFQGTDPREFERARITFALKALQADREFLDLSLDRSFRSAPAVLELVDRLITDLGHEQMGLFTPAERHAAHHHVMSGRVTLLRALSHEDALDDEGEEGFADSATRAYASRLAKQVRQWLDERLWLASKKRPIRPEDILILVRRRADLASLIVARLHAEKVPVAGVDRLRLTAPLAVKDLLAAVRFAVQREDDLSLAALLVSPLFGWSHEDLHRVGFGRRGALIDAVRATGDSETIVALDDILGRADFTTPYRFLEHLLTGPLDGRRKLLRRLGHEARDPIEELLGAALQFEGGATATLQRFLDWFDRGDVEITRDPSAPLDAVRVMTVHGSKGLEAPLVILADATADPDLSPERRLDWAIDENALPVPILRPRKSEMVDALREDAEQLAKRERQEHWRLLYVALTRAQEHLVIGGALGVRAKGVPPAASWYQAVEQAMGGLGCEPADDALWISARHYHGSVRSAGAAMPTRPKGAAPILTEPAWLHAPAPVEARPPRPLAPSSIGPDDVADPPPSAALREAARRGTLLHALFERLPSIAADARRAAAEHWLLSSAGIDDPAYAGSLAGDACRVIADPRFTAIFGPDALAEAPIAAVVDGDVIAGTVDRLLVTGDRILVVDFKTSRRAPADLTGAPLHHVRQMAAYAAALRVIFPGRTVEAALLYTAGPSLIEVPAVVLEGHKPGFRGEEQKQGASG